ncbi:MAG: hypothetical protein EXR27_07720 [Betaproteobacteria bacterium]|nr:hypothetical protein [Betaproteobacteria bacterium]
MEQLIGRALPAGQPGQFAELELYYQALNNFFRTFDIRSDDRMVILADRLLDNRVIAAISGLALSRGVRPVVVSMPNSQILAIPDDVKPILEKATFVVSTWYCSVMDPYCVALRRDRGQRWVKITFFRNLDLLHAPHARFPVDLISEIIRATAARLPRDRAFNMQFTDKRGSDLSIGLTPRMNDGNLNTNRWRGQLLANEPGAYVHYIPTHGPNLYERGPSVDSPDQVVPVNGTIYPQWAIGFERPFLEPIGVRFADDRVVEVTGHSEEAAILRNMLIGSQLIELGCGFNPKWPRHLVYPAGSNSPGALHFGVDMVKESEYVKKMMPAWEEPPTHMDLISFDCSVRAGDRPVVTDGFLEALRDPQVVELAKRYGDPLELLENWPA